MDPRILGYYSKELSYMREMSAEFARQHPKIAGRLGMQGIEVADPYVERMIEAFCFMTARTQMKLDEEFPRLTQRLLEVVYPHYVAPMPSISVIQMLPAPSQGYAGQGFMVPANTTFRSEIPQGEQTACEFRSRRDVRLWPVELVSAELMEAPQALSGKVNLRALPRKVTGALVMILRTHAEGGFARLQGLDSLPVYIAGEESIASRLFELIHASHAGSVIRAADDKAGDAHVIEKAAVQFDALQPEHGLLPRQWNTFHGHQLLQEYLACSSAFYFFTLTGLEKGLQNIAGQEAQVVLLLERFDAQLVPHVQAALLRLFCTPVINLFPKRTDQIVLHHAQTEQHVVPDRTRPLDYEVYAVERASGYQRASVQEMIFKPMYSVSCHDLAQQERYFSVRREQRVIRDSRRGQGARSAYPGTEVFLTLADRQHAPYHADLHSLCVDALVTNRDLPGLLRQTQAGLSMPASAPVTSVHFVHHPSLPRPPVAHGETAWRLIRQLAFNYQPLHDLPEAEGARLLRELLHLHVLPQEREQQVQIDSLIGAHTGPVVSRLPDRGLLMYGRGVQCRLTIDESGFSGGSPYLFGLILHHYLARHVAINVFVQTELHTVQRGAISRWQPRFGQRGVV